MINIKQNNKIFAELVIELIKNKYDILYYDIIPYDESWDRLMIVFYINLKNNFIVVPIYYQVQVMDKLVEDISKKIDEYIIKSYIR